MKDSNSQKIKLSDGTKEGVVRGLPQHVVLVPDGNRRWAARKGRPGYFGHRAGAESAQKIFKFAYESGLPCVTLWGCSVSNVTKRSPIEVRFLFKIFDRTFKKLAKRKEIGKDKIKIQVLGRWEEFFPEYVKKTIRHLIKSTEKNDGRKLNFLMAYDGRDEMQAAVRKIAAEKIPAEEVTPERIKGSLWTKNLPPVDLVIRTGGEPHWSAGMMMWDVAEAQLYFTETFWPDFSPAEFQKALDIYAGRERRHGK
ncbi:MAG: polyprenyl diphosphate synthase [Candidatus Liptonbacteria bacterium]